MAQFLKVEGNQHKAILRISESSPCPDMGESLGSFLTIEFPSTWLSIALVDASAVAEDTHNRDGRHGWLSEFRSVITFHTMPQIVTDPKLSTIVPCMPSVFLSFISVTAAFLARPYALSKSQGQKAGAREFRSERQRKGL